MEQDKGVAPASQSPGHQPSASAADASSRSGVPNAWRCGCPRTPENTKRVRNGTAVACRACFNAHNRTYLREKRAAQAEIDGRIIVPRRSRYKATGA